MDFSNVRNRGTSLLSRAYPIKGGQDMTKEQLLMSNENRFDFSNLRYPLAIAWARLFWRCRSCRTPETRRAAA